MPRPHHYPPPPDPKTPPPASPSFIGAASMSTSRRNFIRATAAAGGAVGLGLIPRILAGQGAERPAAPERVRRAAKPLNLLILGGTGFIGPHQVEYALKRGHKLTLFNRGKTNPGL